MTRDIFAKVADHGSVVHEPLACNLEYFGRKILENLTLIEQRSQYDIYQDLVRTNQDVVKILLDGAVLGKTPYHGTLPRQEGSITLVVRLTGYVDRRVVVAPTQSINVKLKLVRIAPVRSAKDNPDESVNPF